ncbi:unnamed protein product [Dovyalis caffra]|uniref:Nucleotide-diphospho-sugar transferase domain-containing protein n=1 Tax=Dovyalis caffra TaxID=77055 RepID=A0AAV1R5M2_9ROSI|nr:unnamed protein product [Dovyalis caffra]
MIKGRFAIGNKSFLLSTPLILHGLNPDSRKLQQLLRTASTPSRIVILTIVDKSWASPGSVLDLFLESLRIGEGTKHLLNHLVIVGFDFKAFRYCQFVHPHCIHLKDTGIGSYANEIKKRGIRKPSNRLNYHTLNWRRIQILEEVVQSGYNVIYTDADVMWLRNPFPILVAEFELTIGCDSKSSNQSSINEYSSGGFFFMRSDEITIEFLKLWNLGRFLYPSMATELVCQRITDKEFVEMVGLRIKHIDNRYYSGLCEPSIDTREIYIMHGNCCSDLDSKVHDLNLVLEDSRRFNALLAKDNSSALLSPSGKAPMKCSTR